MGTCWLLLTDIVDDRRACASDTDRRAPEDVSRPDDVDRIGVEAPPRCPWQDGRVRYVGKLYRPPSEADALILQATVGCSWNHCTYCDMYRDKPEFRVRPVAESLEDLEGAAREVGPHVDKVFVADGDALVMDLAH